MPRIARIVAPGLPHHLTARGNRRSNIFEDDTDRRVYLQQLQKYCVKARVRVFAYCLMTNHVHLVAVPTTADSLERVMRPLQTSYSLYFNRRQGYSGRLWEGRFFSCVLDDDHLWTAVRYVETNPVRAGLVEQAQDYPWSSAAGHCDLREDALLAADFPPAGVVDDWAQWLGFDNREQEEKLRAFTDSGRPAGGAGFVQKLEGLMGRSLAARKRGRPRKTGK